MGQVRERKNSDLRGLTGLPPQFLFLRQRGLRCIQRCWNRQPPGPRLGKHRASWSPQRGPHASPRGGPYTPGAPPWRRASSLCSDPVLSLDDWRPGPLRPDPSQGRPAPGAAPLRSGVCLRSAAPAAEGASSGLPWGRPRWAPRSLPPHWDSGPSALVPPGPCSSNGSWLPSRSPCQNWASVYWRQITSEREF